MRNNTLLKVMIAIALAVVAGLLSGPDNGFFGVTFLQIYGLIGQLFLNALTLVVVPLVASSIITGAAKMGAEKSVGTLGVKTFGYFILTLMLASLVGLGAAHLMEPGISQHASAALAPAQATEQLTFIEEQAQGNTFDRFSQIILKIIPSNILAVASQGQMLGLIFFSLLF